MSDRSEKNVARLKAEAKIAKVQALAEEKERKRVLALQQQQMANASKWHELINNALESGGSSSDASAMHTGSSTNDIGSATLNPREDATVAKEIMQLAMKGIPVNMRGSVWPLLIGNAVACSRGEFEGLRSKADALRVAAGLGSSFQTGGSGTGGNSRGTSPWLSPATSGHVEAALVTGGAAVGAMGLATGRGSWSAAPGDIGPGHGRDERGKASAPQVLGAAGGNSNSSSSRHAPMSWPDSLPLPAGDILDTQSADDSFSLGGTDVPEVSSGGSMTFASPVPAPVPAAASSTTASEGDEDKAPLETQAGTGAGAGAGAGAPPQDGDTNVLSLSLSLSVLSDDIDLSKAFAFDMPTPPRSPGRQRNSVVKSKSNVPAPGAVSTRPLSGVDRTVYIEERDRNSAHARPKSVDSATSIGGGGGGPGSLDGLVDKLRALEADLSRGSGSISKGRVPPEQQRELDLMEQRRHTALLIKWDLPRTFPTLKFFHDGGSIHADLERILCAYTLYRPDVGYVQGMSFVAAMLLLYLDDCAAFQCLANLLSRKGTCDFFSLQHRHVQAYVVCFDYFFQLKLPLLFAHMRQQDLSSEMFLMDWHLTLFAKALHLDAAARVWDCYLAGGELFFVRCALGILRLYAPMLCQMSLEALMAFLMHLPTDLRAEDLMESVEQIKITDKQYEKRIAELDVAAGSGAGSGSGTGRSFSDAEQNAASRRKDVQSQRGAADGAGPPVGAAGTKGAKKQSSDCSIQ